MELCVGARAYGSDERCRRGTTQRRKGNLMAKSVFYSFHCDRDVHRVQAGPQLNALEGQPVLNAQEWETVSRGGETAIKNWLDKQMAYKEGHHRPDRSPDGRPWVTYKIEKAWADKKPLLGIHIHGLAPLNDGTDLKGLNPFDKASIGSVPIFDPTVTDWNGKIDSKTTYNALRNNIESWLNRGAVKASW